MKIQIFNIYQTGEQILADANLIGDTGEVLGGQTSDITSAKDKDAAKEIIRKSLQPYINANSIFNKLSTLKGQEINI